jgi:hypothetical protein
MHKYLPDIKLIWILRNPIQRAYSHYKMYVNKGVEKMSFEEAIYYDKKHKMKNHYLGLGEYSVIINEYLKYYDLTKMHFVLFENFIKNPQKELDSICEFLGISKMVFTTNIHERKSYPPKSVFLQNIFRKIIYSNINGHSIIRPKRIRTPMFDLLSNLNKSNKSFPQLPLAVKINLAKHYELYNKDLEILTGINIDTWNKID